MSEATKHLDLFQYIGIMRRRKWVIIIPLLLSYGGFLIYGFVSPRKYQAQAIILIEEKKMVNPLLKNLAVSRSVSGKMNALREEILAWPRIFQLVEQLKLNKNIKDPIKLEKLIFDIRENIVLQLKTPEVLIIGFRGEDALGTQKLTNTLCDILIKRSESLQQEETESAVDFINEQLALYKTKVVESDKQLREFREVYGAGSATGASLPLDKINREIAAFEADLIMAYVDCTDDHPRVKGLKRRIADLKATRNEHVQVLAQRAGVDPRSFVSIADSIPRQHEELTSLTRDKAVNEKLYTMFTERLESAKITESLDQSENRTKFRIIEPARLPLFPVEPDMAKLNFLGILVGCMVGFGCMYLLEYVDSSFKGEAGLKEAFGTIVFGSVAKIITEADLAMKRKRSRKAIQTLIIVFFVVFIIFIVLSKVAGA